MDLWQLHIFCKVAELKSFSEAGKTVHLSQPTVSSHIRDLEEHFGCRLIDRFSKQAVPTPAGDLLYQYACRLLALRDETEAALAEYHGTIRGQLRIGGSTIPGTYILPPLIGPFIQRYPQARIALTIGDTEQVLNQTLSGELEMGVVGAKARDKRISQEKIASDEMKLIVPTDHAWAGHARIGLDRLVKEPFILREKGSGTLKSFQDSLKSSAYAIDDFNVVARMGSTESVIQGVRARIGVSVLSYRAVAERVLAGELCALSVQGLNLCRSFYLSRYRYKSLSPLGRAFISFLKENGQIKQP
jgi:DNA-binding transcriptional LysR family regulator